MFSRLSIYKLHIFVQILTGKLTHVRYLSVLNQNSSFQCHPKIDIIDIVSIGPLIGLLLLQYDTGTTTSTTESKN